MARSSILFVLATASTASAFVSNQQSMGAMCRSNTASPLPFTHTTNRDMQLYMVDDTKEKAAPMVTGEELEKMLQEWETPLVVDAYATW